LGGVRPELPGALSAELVDENVVRAVAVVLHTSASVSIRQHPSAYAIRQHTSAYVSIARQECGRIRGG
jgi:hypothetical protein